ncbi:hypothetical protein F5148DRAFT_1281010 [Russula earlei]|uniref:Uncharacterized protein n=1 Tax=Russula earlei TaxID=71964 RepID=A0ACC0UK48_9AGAM|nr:hypothetical protein F5148DRAFT_1281010 [Russula earlei]
MPNVHMIPLPAFLPFQEDHLRNLLPPNHDSLASILGLTLAYLKHLHPTKLAQPDKSMWASAHLLKLFLNDTFTMSLPLETNTYSTAPAKELNSLQTCLTSLETTLTNLTKATTNEQEDEPNNEEIPDGDCPHHHPTPSWVQPPHTYSPGTNSSLSFSFEDPDGTKAQTLLHSHILHMLGHVVTLKRWKNAPHKNPTKTQAAKPPIPHTPSPGPNHPQQAEPTTPIPQQQTKQGPFTPLTPPT